MSNERFQNGKSAPAGAVVGSAGGSGAATGSGSGVDELGARLLRLLADDPRRGASDLARELGVSAPTVRDRVRRLEEAGVIRGYRLDVDPAALGLPVAAWVRLRPGPGQMSRVTELVRQTPEVSECHRISGEDCFLIKVHVSELGDLETVLDRFLVHGQTTSSLVVSTPVPPRPVLP
ncbi:Lrp/AsnC family transcriptional regulator [Streptomyces armeniacus]|uniref:Lrp/AsnC family transcriptional regulator n=1 Tax=Streptomyces armeniacus TaxID=83291 RepID=A0A345XKY8_9ACTN|nr:Lrp/AsnC family transcriptional regulator [Streptomyces armeniacus]AXK32304.1 Lrp/AsnC family transcriptional regulator [Streptomyces armeniacus]